MNTYSDEKQQKENTRLSPIVLTLTSAVLGSAALWYTRVRYDLLANHPDPSWYNWVQLALIALMGMLCLSASFLFIGGKPSARSVFRAGLSIVPLLLFTNLVVLVFRVLLNIFQGNGAAFLSRLYASPFNKAILGVIFVLILLSLLKELKKS